MPIQKISPSKNFTNITYFEVPEDSILLNMPGMKLEFKSFLTML